MFFNFGEGVIKRSYKYIKQLLKNKKVKNEMKKTNKKMKLILSGFTIGVVLCCVICRGNNNIDLDFPIGSLSLISINVDSPQSNQQIMVSDQSAITIESEQVPSSIVEPVVETCNL